MGRSIVICPKCSEVNSSTFRFCGMCGTLLDTRRPAGTPATEGTPQLTNAPDPLSPGVVESTSRVANRVTAISGPSMLGLDQPAPQPSMDSLRDTAFSGLDSFREPERSKGKGRVLLLLALLAALGGAGWWTYTNYLGVAGRRNPEPATSSTSETPANTSTTKSAAQDASSIPDASAAPAAIPSAGVRDRAAENTSPASEASGKVTDAETKPSPEAKPATPTTVVHAENIPEKHAPSVAAKPSNLPAPTAADNGDAAFRKGEAYLYGRGGTENCDEAVKNLKAASAKSNAKARSAFGTMYATGHCVPRDLPTSYLWFALALRVDPNNQILEKDLSAIWNQMTPPERQMATRMKQ